MPTVLPTPPRARASSGVALLALAALGCDSGTEPPDPARRVATLALEGVAPASAFVGSAVSGVVVQAVDAAGEPVPGAVVTFRTARGSTLAAAHDTTDASGLATPGAWTLPTTPTADTLIASAGSAPELRVPLVVRAGPVSRLELLAPATGQGEVLRSLLAGPLFRALDRYGNPVAFADVELRDEPGPTGIVPASRVQRVVATDAEGVVRIDEWVPRTLGEHALRGVALPGAGVSSAVVRREVHAPACAPIAVLAPFALRADSAGAGSLNVDPSAACRDTVDRWAVGLAQADLLLARPSIISSPDPRRYRLVRAGSLDAAQVVAPPRPQGLEALLPAGEYEVVVSASGTARADYGLWGAIGPVTSCDTTYLLPGSAGALRGNCGLTVPEAGLTEAPGKALALHVAGAAGRDLDILVEAIEATGFGSPPTSHQWSPVLAVYRRVGTGTPEFVTLVRSSTGLGRVQLRVPEPYTDALIVVTAEGQSGRTLHFRVSAR